MIDLSIGQRRALGFGTILVLLAGPIGLSLVESPRIPALLALAALMLGAGMSLQHALAHRKISRLAAELQEKNELLQAQREKFQAQGEEIQAQHEELQRQRAQLAEADRLKDEFLSVAAHELKSPITSLKGFAQLALRRARRSQAELGEFIDALSTIDQQANRLVARIDRLLDVSRAQMGRLQIRLEPVDLVTLVWRQVKQAQARTELHRIAVDATLDPLGGRWDRGYLEQAIDNLLENAIRYSPNGGPIQVTVRPVDGEAHVSVTDCGIGMPPDVLPQLFHPYFRAEAARRVAADGLGVGLYLSREIVAAHGGRVWVESEVGKGSTFTVALPLG